MSKARLVITAVTIEKRQVGEVAKSYGVARSWIYTLLARYEAEGEAAFEPRSRRPKTSPSATSADIVDLIVRLRKDLAGQGLDAGPQTITWHLQQHHHVKVSPATVSRVLARSGLVTPDPSKRPKSSYIRFEASMPNECWQSDFTHYPLAGGADTEILTWLDDHSRYALSLFAGVPAISAYLCIYIVAFAWMQSEIVCLSLRTIRVGGRIWLRRGLRTTAAGAVLGLVYCVVRASDVITAATGFANPVRWEDIARLAVGIGVVLPPIGWTMPSWGPRLSRARVWAANVRDYWHFYPLWSAKRADPGDDLISALIQARDGDDRLDENELVSLVFLLLWAGYETTVDLIGNGLLLIFTNPDVHDGLLTGRHTMPDVIEEILRFDAPAILGIRRFATEDLELGGAAIAAGDTVMVSLAAANHDPARFESPGVFMPGRHDSGHLAFGYGIHHCLGVPLARLEGRIAIDSILRRYPAIQLADPVADLTWRPSIRSHGLRFLPVLIKA